MADVPRYDLTRVVLTVLFIGGLIAASFWILRPFIGPTIWAIMIVVPTWSADARRRSAIWVAGAGSR